MTIHSTCVYLIVSRYALWQQFLFLSLVKSCIMQKLFTLQTLFRFCLDGRQLRSSLAHLQPLAVKIPALLCPFIRLALCVCVQKCNGKVSTIFSSRFSRLFTILTAPEMCVLLTNYTSYAVPFHLVMSIMNFIWALCVNVELAWCTFAHS